MSTKQRICCPACGHETSVYYNPAPTVDIVIEYGDKIVLIQRKNPPLGWAIPGGFVDYGETVESAALREAKEETALDCRLIHLLGVYSDPSRDPRQHSISTVFVASGSGNPKAMDDAADLALFDIHALPKVLAFDHAHILQDYLAWRREHSHKLPRT